MERRYKLMSKLGVRNLAGYNKKIAEAAERGEQHPQPVQPDARAARAAGAPAVHRRRHRRARRPDDGRRQEDRGADRAPGAEGARRRHPPDPGDAAAERRRDHRPDQGQHPDPALVPGRRARSTRAPSSTRWAPRRCSAWATCSTCRRARGLPVRVHGAFVSDEEVHRVVAYLKTPGRAELHRRHPRRRHARRRRRRRPAATARRRRRRERPDVRPGGRRSCCSTGAPRSRWCSAICASATTAPRGCWNKWRNPGSYRAWRPTATATSSSRRAPNERAARRVLAAGARRCSALRRSAARRPTPVDTLRELRARREDRPRRSSPRP